MRLENVLIRNFSAGYRTATASLIFTLPPNTSSSSSFSSSPALLLFLSFCTIFSIVPAVGGGPASNSHTITVPSSLPVTSHLRSGDNSITTTPFGWDPISLSTSPVNGEKAFIVQSADTVKTTSPLQMYVAPCVAALWPLSTFLHCPRVWGLFSHRTHERACRHVIASACPNTRSLSPILASRFAWRRLSFSSMVRLVEP
mmetsp:Transcript_35667/g.57509  ORF Transcript_35667/g.57509 Transcript_35667/m.57509 type:complete len:200 (-) Transcript_35667:527-1126(-)